MIKSIFGVTRSMYTQSVRKQATIVDQNPKSRASSLEDSGKNLLAVTFNAPHDTTKQVLPSIFIAQ